MAEHIQTLESLRRISRSHLRGAHESSHATPKAGQAPILPMSVAYLAHVAIECALKVRLLYRSGCASKEELAAKQPSIHRAMFQGKQGHDLQLVATQVRLRAAMVSEGKAWKEDDCWKRMASLNRPYSLRYGFEALTKLEAEQELARAEEIVSAILAGTPTLSLNSAKSRGKR